MVLRNLEFNIKADDIRKICIDCIKDPDCIVEMNNEVLDVEGIGCIVIALKNLD